MVAAGNSNPGNYWVVGVGEESHRDRHDSLCRVLDLKDSESCTRHGRKYLSAFNPLYTNELFLLVSHNKLGTMVNCILKVKSLAIYFGDLQFRRKRIFNFIISKLYVDTRPEYNEINQLAFHIMLSPILSPFAKTAYPEL